MGKAPQLCHFCLSSVFQDAQEAWILKIKLVEPKRGDTWLFQDSSFEACSYKMNSSQERFPGFHAEKTSTMHMGLESVEFLFSSDVSLRASWSPNHQ